MAAPEGWITRYLQQDASLIGTLLAFGLSSAVILIAATVPFDLSHDSLFALAVVMGPILFLPGPVVLIARLFRRGDRSRAVRCEACGAQPAAEVRCLQVTGVVVLVIVREARLVACARCAGEALTATTTHTLLLGWWSPLSILVLPWVLAANGLAWIKSRFSLGGSRGAVSALEPEREYAMNLLRSKDPETVVEVIARKTGLPPAEVEKWVATLVSKRVEG